MALFRWHRRPSAESRLGEIRGWFRGAFGVPIPDMLIPAGRLVALDRDIEGSPALLVGSPVAARDPLLYGAERMMRFSVAPPGYFLMGYWAKGVNSHALYYCRVDRSSRVFFRIAFGGVYTNNDRLRETIPQFLRRYSRYEAEALGRGGRIESCHHMLCGHYGVTWPDGVTRRVPDEADAYQDDLVGCPFERLLVGGRET